MLTRNIRLSLVCAAASLAVAPAARAQWAVIDVGGVGYVEDEQRFNVARLLRDANALPIWEGTTNVLSLDLLRAVGKGGSMAPIEREVSRRAEHAHDSSCAQAGRKAIEAVAHARSWLEATAPAACESPRRRPP